MRWTRWNDTVDCCCNFLYYNSRNNNINNIIIIVIIITMEHTHNKGFTAHTHTHTCIWFTWFIHRKYKDAIANFQQAIDICEDMQ